MLLMTSSLEDSHRGSVCNLPCTIAALVQHQGGKLDEQHQGGKLDEQEPGRSVSLCTTRGATKLP